MRFAENNRISHRQLYRQLVLAFVAPFFLCLVGRDGLVGLNGIAGVAAAVVLLVFYVIALIRLTPYYTHPIKSLGGFWGRVVGVFFLSYVLFTGAFLLHILAEIVPEGLVAGISGGWIAFFTVLVCSFGAHRGMQPRGRAAEVSGGVVLAVLLLLMVLCAGQGKLAYLEEMAGAGMTGKGFGESVYQVLCAFAGVGLLPFALGDVQKQGSSKKAAIFAVVTLGVLLLAMELLLPAVLGWDRLQGEKYPVLPLLAGADLPGNLLSRFDVLWMGFLIYGLLFSIGSLFHYGHQIIGRTALFTGRVWMAAVVFLLAFGRLEGYGIEDYYGWYLGYIFVPGLLLLQLILMTGGNMKRRKKAAASAAAVLALCLFLGGCAGVEPEKRLYALALGVDAAPEGYAVTYGTPDMTEATGQEKPEESEKEVLTVTGSSFSRIEELYGQSQEKYMDMGHVQVLILGEELIADGRWQAVLDYLKQEPFVGEDIYVFRGKNAREILSWQGAKGSSVGEYLQGLLENGFDGRQNGTGVTLRELYHEKYKTGTLLTLPKVVLENDELQVVYE